MEAQFVRIACTQPFGYRMHSLHDIQYIQADKAGAIVYIVGHPQYRCSKSLAKMESLLGGAPFVRTHHQYIVNLRHVVAYHHGRHTLELANGVHIPVAVRRLKAILKGFMIL